MRGLAPTLCATVLSIICQAISINLYAQNSGQYSAGTLQFKDWVNHLEATYGIALIYESGKFDSHNLPVPEAAAANPIPDLERQLTNYNLGLRQVSDNLYVLYTLQKRREAASRVGLKGWVFDENKQPFPGAHITLNNSKTGTTSLADGSFHLHGLPLGKQYITISALGYKDVQIQIAATKATTVEYSVSLQPDLLKLDQVVITGIATPQT